MATPLLPGSNDTTCSNTFLQHWAVVWLSQTRHKHTYILKTKHNVFKVLTFATKVNYLIGEYYFLGNRYILCNGFLIFARHFFTTLIRILCKVFLTEKWLEKGQNRSKTLQFWASFTISDLFHSCDKPENLVLRNYLLAII